MKMTKSHSKKLAASVAAAGILTVSLLSGTFAWQSLSQSANNEAMGSGINPGGRLHDDFDGKNKAVYVENFGDVPIFARVRIDEYMELGESAGSKTDRGENGAKPVIPNTDINHVSGWVTHIPREEDFGRCDSGDPEKLHDYLKLNFGGKTTYMPTFDRNKDSLKPDINGTLEGKYGKPYDDYIRWTAGQTLTGDEIYDADADGDDEALPQEGADITIKPNQTHAAVDTPTAKVMTMKQWRDAGRPMEDIWVYDTDGWAYYAKAIPPKSSTGLFLNSAELIREPFENWYFGLNVLAQFTTANDWGKEDNSGFFDPSYTASNPTPEAMILLGQASGDLDVTITEADRKNSAAKGESLTFTALVGVGTTPVGPQDVTWEVVAPADQNMAEGTGISADGVLTIAGDETSTELMVRAYMKQNNQIYGQYHVAILP